MNGIYLALVMMVLPQEIWGVEKIALSMVPRGKLVDTIGRDYIIKTPAGTKIEIEFKRSGKFDEAKGQNLNKGDELEPGEGLISLSSAAQILNATGKKPEGHWRLEEDPDLGWIYELKMTIIHAKTGKIIQQEL
jgi:hypothetical protein